MASQGRTTAGTDADPCRGRRVLVVDDDAVVVDIVTRYLTAAGCTVEQAADGPSAVASVAEGSPDLVVLDLMLPGYDGLEAFRRMRTTSSVPVIMLTALDGTDDRVAGLELGADDYLAKPFSPRELVARVRNLLRHVVPPAEADPVTAEIVASGNLAADTRGRRASLSGVDLTLTTLEFDLLTHFLSHPGTAFTREELLGAVWGYDIGDTATVTVHVRRVREKIEADPADPRRITTVWGYGYRFDG